MYDRDPKEFCFRFNNRFLVYFAVDLFEVAMTTQLQGEETFFLPFNQGSNGAGNIGDGGNPVCPDGYATAYLWEYILSREMFLSIFQRYIIKQTKEKITLVNGKKVKNTKTFIIFPRYHQLEVVTDRRVLNNQLQETILGFDHYEGRIVTITDKDNSSALRQAIIDKKKIIITTLQRFPLIYKELDNHKGKKFAIIVDEAHSSQSGKSAEKLKAALADTDDALKEWAEIEGKTEDEVKDLIEQGTEDGTFEKEEQHMVDRIFHMSDQNAYSLMTPRTQMIWLDLDDSLQHNLDIIKENPSQVFAVARGSLDNFSGVIYAKELLDAMLSGKPAALEPYIQNEYGGVIGFITLSDIME